MVLHSIFPRVLSSEHLITLEDLRMRLKETLRYSKPVFFGLSEIRAIGHAHSHL
jgi:hypothetical protein